MGYNHTLRWKTIIKMLILPKLAYCFIVIIVIISLGIKQVFGNLTWLRGQKLEYRAHQGERILINIPDFQVTLLKGYAL